MTPASGSLLPASDPAYLASIDYRWGQLQAIRYDKLRTDIFPGPSYLTTLYELTRLSGRSHLGSLPLLFCGMMDLSCEAIVSYLHQRPVVVLGEWRDQPEFNGKLKAFDDEAGGYRWEYEPEHHDVKLDPSFHPLGYCFPSTPIAISRSSSSATPRNSTFGGYGFFQEAWGTGAQQILSWIGLAWLFNELQLSSLHGVRYEHNRLTARWCEQFGFETVGTLPDYMPHYPDGDLVPGVVSTLSRTEFSRRLAEILAQVEELPVPPAAPPAAPPAQP